MVYSIFWLLQHPYVNNSYISTQFRSFSWASESYVHLTSTHRCLLGFHINVCETELVISSHLCKPRPLPVFSISAKENTICPESWDFYLIAGIPLPSTQSTHQSRWLYPPHPVLGVSMSVRILHCQTGRLLQGPPHCTFCSSLAPP